MTLSCCQATQGARFSCHLHSRMIDCEQSRRDFHSSPFPFASPTFTPREIRLNKRSFYGNLARRHPSSFSKFQRAKKISNAKLFKEQDGANANAQVHSKLFAAARKISRLKQEIPNIIGPCTRRRERLFLIEQYINRNRESLPWDQRVLRVLMIMMIFSFEHRQY